jgi:hypothetical protein
VIDKDVLDEIFTHDKYYDFMKFWLGERDIKAVVSRTAWNAFEKEWGKSLEDKSESSETFFAIMRGIVSPYVKPEGSSDVDKDALSETMDIVNRHYATVEYLVVKVPPLYEGKGIKIGDDRIFTPRGFFMEISTTDNRFVKVFQDGYEAD